MYFEFRCFFLYIVLAFIEHGKAKPRITLSLFGDWCVFSLILNLYRLRDENWMSVFLNWALKWRFSVLFIVLNLSLLFIYKTVAVISKHIHVSSLSPDELGFIAIINTASDYLCQWWNWSIQKKLRHVQKPNCEIYSKTQGILFKSRFLEPCDTSTH